MSNVIPFPKKPEPTDEPIEILTATMFSDGRVRVWLSDDVQSAEQYLWVQERVSTVSDVVRELRIDRGQEQ